MAVKGPEDIKRSLHLKVLQKTSSSVYRSRLPPRSIRNTKHSHALPGFRNLRRRMKQDWEDRTAEVLRVLEVHRYGKANSLYSALDSTTKMLNDVNKRKTEIETFAEELEASNEEIQASNSELQNITDELERTNSDLEQFAFVVSHDLNRPISTIQSQAAILAENIKGHSSEEDIQSLQSIASQAGNMSGLIESVLIYSRVALDTTPFKKTDIEKVLNQAVIELGDIFQESNAKIVHDELPSVAVDWVQLSQVFKNVISNSIKFALPGETPYVEILVQEEKDDWLFSFTDRGIGIPIDRANDAFKMFVKLHDQKEYKGFGLGLSISEKIILRHMGSIWMTSEGKGSGCTLSFTIPKDLEEETADPKLLGSEPLKLESV